MNRTVFVIGFFVAAVVVGLLMRFNVRLPIGRENFIQKEAGMPINGPGMGPYDQNSMGGWASSEGMPVGPSPVATPVDDNKLMFMVGDRTSPSCKGSPFSTDTGYLCLSGSELDLMARRGGNK